MNNAKIERLTKMYMAQEGMTARKLKNRLMKEEKIEMNERQQTPVKSMVITIEWKKSATWGYNPCLNARIQFENGTYEITNNYRCSGCGYDKESTVLAQLLNDYLKYKLWERESMDNSKKPYGVTLNFLWNPHFNGGVGTSCYYDIMKWLGGKLEHTASGKSFDVYTITFGGEN